MCQTRSNALTHVKEDDTNLFSRIKSFAKSSIDKCKLVYCGIASYQSRLKRSKKVVIFQMVVGMLKDELSNTSSSGLSNEIGL